MKRNTRVRLDVEALEARWMPATIIFNGNLTISNARIFSSGGVSQTKLEVTQQANGLWLVSDNGASVGQYNVTGSITITGSNVNDTIAVQAASGKSLPANLTINAGNGNDTVTIEGNGTGEVRGNVSVDGGNGNDQIRVANTTGLTIRGSTNLSAGLGTDSVQVAFGGSATFLGTLGFFGFNNFNYSIANTTLGSGLTFSQRLNPTSGSFKPFALNAGTGAIAIPGIFKVEAGTLNDNINVNAISVGSLVITMGGGSDSLTINTDVQGNAAVTFGTGPGTITVAAATTINSNAQTGAGFILNMGEGVNTFNLNTAFTVFGNMTINTPANGAINQNLVLGANIQKTNPPTSTDGNLVVKTGFGDDTFTLNGIVDGNVTVNLGQGNNSFTVASTASFSDLTFTAGDGDNTVDIAVPDPAGTHNLTLTFGGGGTNNVTLSGGASGGGTVTIKWTDGIADDTLSSTLGLGYTITETGVR